MVRRWPKRRYETHTCIVSFDCAVAVFLIHENKESLRTCRVLYYSC